jgi:hypothetical protein
MKIEIWCWMYLKRRILQEVQCNRMAFTTPFLNYQITYDSHLSNLNIPRILGINYAVKSKVFCKILGFHGRDYEECRLFGCEDVSLL